MPCFCKKGIMAQCTVADDYGRQQICEWFDDSVGVKKCMHLNRSMNNHCWSQNAQNTGLVEDDGWNTIDDCIVEDHTKKRTCGDCVLFACTRIIDLNSQKPGGLTHEDLEQTASSCENYDDESTLKALARDIARGGQR